MRPSTDELSTAILAAGRLLGGAYVDHRPLPARRRRALVGQFSPEAPEIVRQIARVLGDYTALFPDSRVPGPELLRMQETAEHWGHFSIVLTYLLVFAYDQYLESQGEAIDAAMEVVRRFKGEARLPGAEHNPALPARGAALLQVLHALDRRRRRKVRLPQRKAPLRRSPEIDIDAVFESFLDEFNARRRP